MKKYIYFSIVIAIIAGSILTATTLSKGPESTVEQYVKALNTGQYEKAKKLATPESAQAINYYHGMMIMAGGSEMVKQMQKTKIEIKQTQCITLAETAVCSCTYIAKGDVLSGDEGPKELSEEFNLTKVNGKWLISVKKENPFGEGEEEFETEEEAPYEIDGDQDFDTFDVIPAE